MSTKIFGGGGKVPKADPRVDLVTDDLRREAPKLLARGNSVQTWIDKYDGNRQKRIDGMVNNVNAQGKAVSDQGLQSNAMFNNVYQPAMEMQALDAMGSGWLSPKQQIAQIDEMLANKMKSGLTAAQRKTALRNSKSQKNAIRSQAIAENNAVGVATADAAQAEGRNLEGVSMEAARMGVDPSRILATQGANASDSTAAAVDAAQRARFGVRADRSKNLAAVTGTGLAVGGMGAQQNAAAANIYGGNASTVNQTGHEIVAGKTAALPLTALGLQTMKGAGDLALGKTQANQSAAAQNNANGGGFGDLLGTAAGAYFGSGGTI
jgi:hypothetical protein